MSKELNQQDIVKFRDGDQVLIMQNGREMRIKIEAFIGAIAQAIIDARTGLLTEEGGEAIAQPMRLDINDLKTATGELRTDVGTLADTITAMPTPADIVVPQAAITDPATMATLTILGVGVTATSATVSDLRAKIVSILQALRMAHIIVP